jgi:hypothetical protein
MAILRVGVGLTFNGINGDFTTSGIVTAASFSGNVIGNIVGIASTARSLSSSATGSDLTLTTGLTVGSAFIKPTSVGLGATDTTGRNAGVGTATGTIIYNSSTNTVEVYDGTNWKQLYNQFLATGGAITFAGGKTIHTFTGSGTFRVSNAPPTFSVDYLVVAGGGGGGDDVAGGGGAGGFRTGTGLPISSSPGSYTVTVGSGGAIGLSFRSNGVSGNPSWFGQVGISTITSTGGGGGGGNQQNGLNGGSGGGAGGAPGSSKVAGSGNTPPTSPPQGNNGGGGGGPISGAGGGGGSSAVGGPGSGNNGGNGGNGTASTISGTSVTYAGGGGGGAWSPGTRGSGGSGGGGNGAIPDGGGAAQNGTTNLGGGGGGSSYASGPAGSGGSGIVIIAYPS